MRGSEGLLSVPFARPAAPVAPIRVDSATPEGRRRPNPGHADVVLSLAANGRANHPRATAMWAPAPI